MTIEKNHYPVDIAIYAFVQSAPVHIAIGERNYLCDIRQNKMLLYLSQPNGISVQEPRTAGGVAEKLPMRRSIGTFGVISVQWRVSDITFWS